MKIRALFSSKKYSTPELFKKKYFLRRDTLILDPSGTKNLKQSLKNELNKNLYRYYYCFIRNSENDTKRWMEKYEGALLQYKGLKLNSNEAAIFDELPYIYVDVRYKATIFRPTVEDLLGRFCGYLI